MKRNILTLLLILLSVTLFAQKHTSKDLIGKWEGKDVRSEVGGLIFLANSKVILSMRGSNSPAMTYSADFTSNPIKIDLSLTAQNGTKMQMKGLLQFIDNNTLKFQVFPKGDRPANFDALSSQNVVMLKRSGGF